MTILPSRVVAELEALAPAPTPGAPPIVVTVWLRHGARQLVEARPRVSPLGRRTHPPVLP